MSHAQFYRHCLTAAFQQLRHLSRVQEEARQEVIADVVILDLVVVGGEDVMTRGDHLKTEDPAEASRQENGGEAKRHQSGSLVMGEEEVVVLAGQTAVGMGEEGDDGELSRNNAPAWIMSDIIIAFSLWLLNKRKGRRICYLPSP
ncbi:hypothetical protein E8E12_008248 [Didymella heteroderae]|uniref:Uncharacterized protein n=1 Tax=Didymella heteroderae TaxID=1769908 RepID=A0A9P4WR04_9PLEO|nr:hypothetical protein E8E12_008248 [Didymella heteroderae]